MTQISQFTNETAKKITATNVLALVVFLLFFLSSTLVHANHIVAEAIHAEQQECYICHQGIDNPPELPQIKNLFVASYNNKFFQLVSTQCKVSNYILPPLRAPPIVL